MGVLNWIENNKISAISFFTASVFALHFAHNVYSNHNIKYTMPDETRVVKKMQNPYNPFSELIELGVSPNGSRRLNFYSHKGQLEKSFYHRDGDGLVDEISGFFSDFSGQQKYWKTFSRDVDFKQEPYLFLKADGDFSQHEKYLNL